MWYQLFSKVYERAALRTAEECEPYVAPGSKILDLGTGSGIAANTFKDFFQAEVIGVDVVDQRARPIPFKIIDGKHLPFSDNSFDFVLIIYVLHHAEDPVSLLKEAKRVTKKRIIVYEDLAEGILSSFFCWLHGVSFDKLFQHKRTTSFKTGREWKEIFGQLQLKVVVEKRVSSVLNPVKKKQFILEKK